MYPATVLSVQHSGTHFAMHLLVDIFGVEARYNHFAPAQEKALQNYLKTLPVDHLIVIPTRDKLAVAETWVRRATDDFTGDAALRAIRDVRAAYDVMYRTRPKLRKYYVLKIDVKPSERLYQISNLAHALDAPNLDNKGLQFVEEWPVRGSTEATGERIHEEHKIMVGRAAW